MAGKFLTPKRRATRQRSGFQVSGSKTGSTCLIDKSYLIEPDDGNIVITANNQKLTVVELFYQNIGVLGAGIYLYPSESCQVTLELSWEEDGQKKDKQSILKLDSGYWQGLGLIEELKVPDKYKIISDTKFTCSISTSALVSVYGLLMGVLDNEYLTTHDVYQIFKEKTNIYIPEILYLDPTEDCLEFTLEEGNHRGDGQPIVCKSCNRCDRFLPINIKQEHERKTIGYSNHCIKNAPCKHNSFSRYEILSDNLNPILKDYIVRNNQDSVDEIKSYYGHQLECRVCKKFFVNTPLNPLRNSTQHREDSLRRRALEVLVAELLGKNWIYHEHRINVKTEFDVHIWEKFDKQCFKCGCELSKPNEMDLDHTLPLAYLWPLDNTATCLCPSCNSSKSDRFPIDFYTNEQLELLSQKTGISLENLQSKPINQDAVRALFERVDWFFDNFLDDSEYQKYRDDKKAADLIVKSLHNVLKSSRYEEDLVELYKKKTGRSPSTISLS
ncbi:HNH endonuclease [Planktothrix paucivesiculata]|uniref:HNH nuclease domain-containing protein n=1 Tax=Planktothrix paucivesiculata PCC 9631 TaxID=671071 RepID=A0A7Z9BGL0_9CYAN|nr:HNH endonuclease signature motif containing protein [Planktothrix paucivesiculata]VXD10333.1 conserved hypothetical protein [Planktothrix paucivesiculata PCC 9631]